MMDITPIVKAGLILLGFIITSKLIPYIKSKTTAQQQAEINAWVKIAVAAAQQLFKGQGRGPEKKAYVLSWLEEHNIFFDAGTIDVLIEAAVYELKNGVISITEGVELP